MKILFSSILLIDSIIAFYLFLSPIWSGKELDRANKTLHLYALASAIWSLGFGMLFIQTDAEKAYIWRSIAIFGTVMYMITAQYLICLFAQISEKTRKFFNSIALTGIVPYILSIQRDQTEYFMSTFGMTYRFKPGTVNIIYSAYFIIVSVNIVGIIIHMIHSSEKKRLKIFGKHFLLITSLILVGTVLDMIFPAMGLPALPGSNVTQFWGLIILFYAMDVLNRTRINVSNMSKFIYYSLAMPILVFDDNHQLKIANEAATEFLSLPKDETKLSTRSIEDLFDLQGESIFDFEQSHYNRDTVCLINQAPCNLTISKIQDNYGDIIGYIVNVQDVSERMKYIEELKIARIEADSSNTAKSQFLANMSHEIRTPMNAIIGFSELALQENPSDTLADYLEDIKSSSHNLLTLINDILDISKIESGKMCLVNVMYNTAELLHDIYEIIHTQAASKGLDFQIQIDPKLPSILKGDVNRLRSILINLLNNSVKYTPSGFVKLDIVCSDLNEKPFFIDFRIIDSGIGIKEEELSHLFDAFAQFDQTRNYGKEGTGLGLTLVKGFCTLMNGNIKVESVYGKGSTFTATVEQEILDASPIDTNLIQSHKVKDEFSLGSLRVSEVCSLVVDDNPINCKVISRSMGYYGMDVDIANNGQEAIELCKNKKYDFIFMDQMMPEMDGIEAMRHIRALSDYHETDTYKIIVLTANAIYGVREELLEKGFDEYLSKPVNFRDLEKLLIQFLPSEKLSYSTANNTPASDMTSKNRKLEQELCNLLPSIDVQEGITHCCGEVMDYIEVLKLMSQASDKQLAILQTHFLSNNWKDFMIIAHALKGSCYNIGAKACGDAARKMEIASKEADIDYILSHYESFEGEYKDLMQAIDACLKQLHMDTTPDTQPKTSDYVMDILKQFVQAIGNYDFAKAQMLLEQAKESPNASNHKDLLDQLDSMLNNVAVDEILSLKLD